MDLKDVAVLKEGHALIEGAEGKVANGRLVVVVLLDLRIGSTPVATRARTAGWKQRWVCVPKSNEFETQSST